MDNTNIDKSAQNNGNIQNSDEFILISRRSLTLFFILIVSILSISTLIVLNTKAQEFQLNPTYLKAEKDLMTRSDVYRSASDSHEHIVPMSLYVPSLICINNGVGICDKPTKTTSPGVFSGVNFTAGCNPRTGAVYYGCYCGYGSTCGSPPGTAFNCTPSDNLDFACRQHDMDYGSCNYPDLRLGDPCVPTICHADQKLCQTSTSLLASTAYFKRHGSARDYLMLLNYIFCGRAHGSLCKQYEPIEQCYDTGLLSSTGQEVCQNAFGQFPCSFCSKILKGS